MYIGISRRRFIITSFRSIADAGDSPVTGSKAERFEDISRYLPLLAYNCHPGISAVIHLCHPGGR